MADPAPIYYLNDAPEAIEWAVNYLADRIEDACGVRPTITQQDAEDSYPQRSILVGYPYSSNADEEIFIHNPGMGPLTLTGVDDYRGGYEIAGRTHDTDYMNRGGTVDAVLEFCREYIGVVSAWPGDLGRVTPSQPTLRINKISRKYRPSAKVRSPVRLSNPGKSTPYGISKEWLRENSAFHCLQVRVGHSFKDYYDRFHPDGDPGGNKPEIFALQPNGTRSGFPFESTAKMEVSAPELLAVWKDVNVDEELAFNPGCEEFGAMANDGFLFGHSRDPRALALDYRGPDAIPYTYSYEDQSLTDVVITDRELWFANQCAELVPEGSYVTFAAYGPMRYAPKREMPADNVIIVNVANEWNWPEFKDAKDLFDDWVNWSPRNQLMRSNLGFGYANKHGFPNTHYHEWGKRYKELLGRGCIGFTPDTFWEHHSTQWLTYWLYTRISWNRTLDLDAEVTRVCNAMFGDAGSHIKAYYDEAEQAILSRRVHNADHEDLKLIWSSARLDAMQAHLDAAAAAVTSDSDEEARVEWVQAGLDWCKAYMQCIEYKDLYLHPYQTSGPNLATEANAAETDVDGTAGWSGPVVSQSEVTDGTSFALHITAASGGAKRTLPGTPDELYTVEFRWRHDGSGTGDGRFIFRTTPGDTSEDWTNIYNTDNSEFVTVRRAFAGGDVIQFREVNNENDGGIYVDNFVIYAATEIDIPALETEWQDHVDATQAAAADPSWDIPPLGDYATRSDDVKLPQPGDFDPPENPAEGFE